jgi:hypothetical protein
VEDLANSLSDALLPGVVRTYHGCRTDDAGTYFRNGLLVHDRDRLKAQAAAIIDAHEELRYMKPQLDRAIAEVDNEHDYSRAYVMVSDEALLDSAHYLIHGSEWIMSLFYDDGRSILKGIGAPTLIEIDLPLSVTHSSDRRGLAEDMLQEWTRLACNGQKWVAPINLSSYSECSAQVHCRAFASGFDDGPARRDASLSIACYELQALHWSYPLSSRCGTPAVWIR